MESLRIVHFVESYILHTFFGVQSQPFHTVLHETSLSIKDREFCLNNFFTIPDFFNSVKLVNIIISNTKIDNW